MKKRILFVCLGNTCRSPIAEGLAKKVFGEGWQIGSAGTSVTGIKAASNAVKVLDQIYNVDISGHRPTQFSVQHCNGWDIFVAMDSGIATELKTKYGLDGKGIVVEWAITDPVGADLPFYENTARSIYKNVKDLSENLDKL